MKKTDMEFAESFPAFCRALRAEGAFLVAQDEKHRPNAMTIGWAAIGVIWGEPILTVLVRPSRHTFGLMEKAKRFSVCIPPAGKLGKELAFCGSRSGRDCDKIKECGLKLAAGKEPDVSVLADCVLFYECETVHKTHVLKDNLEAGIIARYYPRGDFHTIYNGRILHAYKSAV
ncbi:MAG TPA: flavin reductase [Elusimicrobia bacterium]|nr:flavin reductase [Elusimicrobiota bacterium]HBT61216.1 flavin reductase [Elusimicrobiota bacterium]